MIWNNFSDKGLILCPQHPYVGVTDSQPELAVDKGMKMFIVFLKTMFRTNNLSLIEAAQSLASCFVILDWLENASIDICSKKGKGFLEEKALI